MCKFKIAKIYFYLLAHFDNDIRITASDIPDYKVYPSMDMNPKQAQKALHLRQKKIQIFDKKTSRTQRKLKDLLSYVMALNIEYPFT